MNADRSHATRKRLIQRSVPHADGATVRLQVADVLGADTLAAMVEVVIGSAIASEVGLAASGLQSGGLVPFMTQADRNLWHSGPWRRLPVERTRSLHSSSSDRAGFCCHSSKDRHGSAAEIGPCQPQPRLSPWVSSTRLRTPRLGSRSTVNSFRTAKPPTLLFSRYHASILAFATNEGSPHSANWRQRCGGS